MAKHSAAKQTHLSYWRLARHAVTNNRQTYLPYLLAATFTVMIFYILLSLSRDPALEQIHGGYVAAEFMTMGSVIVAFFAIIFLFYTNSFLMKQRKKELGLYNILGMEKKHIARILAVETAFLGAVSITAGIVLGICCNKLAYLLIVHLLRGTVTLGFYLSLKTIGNTVLLFAAIFLFTYVNAVRQIHLANPIELLRSAQTGEREPQAKKLIALLGVLCLSAGYVIAVTLQQPLLELLSFVAAILLVILGTYCLFTAGSIALLKLLKRKKSYYYAPSHFFSISGLLYRMKQNAVGLANICILSTMVLVLLSSTVTLMLGIDKTVAVRNPYDITIYASNSNAQQNQQWMQATDNLLTEQQLAATERIAYPYLECAVTITGEQMQTIDNRALITGNTLIQSKSETTKKLLVIPYSAYQNCEAAPVPLTDEQMLLFAVNAALPDNSVALNGQSYTVRALAQPFVHYGMLDFSSNGGYYAVMTDAAFQQFQQVIQQPQRFFYGISLPQERQAQLALTDQLRTVLEAQGFSGRVESKSSMESEILGLYGGLLFLGCFLSAIFLVATVLIIYYKQISEGYEDKNRYEIMQKVGMSQQEVKASIRAQIKIVFFLPLLTAMLHLAFCLPALYKLLTTMGLIQWSQILCSAALCCAVFAVFYAAVFAITSRTYYQIVKR